MSAKRERRSSLVWALLLSAVLHSLVGALVVSSRAPAPRPRSPAPISYVEIIRLPAEEAPASRPPPPDPVLRRRAPRGEPRQQARTAVEATSSAEVSVEATPEDTRPDADRVEAESEQAALGTDSPQIAPAPRRLSLIPDWTVPISNKASRTSRGTTIVNDGLGPTDEEKRRYEAELAQRRLDRELAGVASRGAIANGNLPAPLRGVSSELEEAVGGDHHFVSEERKRNPVGAALSEGFAAWQSTAEQFARSGSPVSSPEDSRAVEESAFGRSFANNPLHFGDTHEQGTMNGQLQSMATLGTIAKKTRGRLRTLVELEQRPSGAPAHARLLEPSGNGDFDRFALLTTLEVAGRLPKDAGSELAWRSVWEFVYEPPRVKVDLLEAQPSGDD